MEKKINTTLLIIFALLFYSCNNGVTPSPVEVVDDVFIIDTLDVKILYDATPGFKYPMIYHSVKSVSQLTEKGNIHGYMYNCDLFDIGYAASYEYMGLQEAGHKFRNQFLFWSYSKLEPGITVPYSYTFTAALEQGSKSYTFNSSTKLIYFNGGIRPESNAIQLTGPENRNYSPIYSIDGNWIYFISKNNFGNDYTAFNKMNTSGNLVEAIETLTYPPATSDTFTLIGDSKIAYVLWQPHQFSKIVIKDLQSGDKTEYEINGYLWDGNLVKVPNLNKFIELQDPNSTNPGYPYKLLIADIDTKKVDTLLKNYDGSIVSYSLNPITNDLYVIVSTNNDTNVLRLNLATNEYSTFLQNIPVQKLIFAPNGIDYALIKKDNNGYSNIFYNKNGTERQITTYPSDVSDFCFSPDGNNIVFSCNRRNELQIWKIKL